MTPGAEVADPELRQELLDKGTAAIHTAIRGLDARVLDPRGDRVLVHVLEEDLVRETGGIVLAVGDKPISRALVLAVGPGTKNEPITDLKPHDIVIMGAHVGQRFDWAGTVELRLVSVKDLLAIVHL